jgi:methionyl-tRNA formyltransferase
MLNIRTANISDIDIYYDWVNDPAVRDSAIHTGGIGYDTHKEWFSKKLADNNAVLFIIHQHAAPFGQVRFDIDKDGVAWIDYSIDAGFRGQGLSAFMLRSAITRLVSLRRDIRKLKAMVKTTNHRSAKIFEKLGFETIAEEVAGNASCTVYEISPSATVKYIIVNSNPVYLHVEKNLIATLGDVYFINRPEDLTIEFLQQAQPQYIFFLHWSHMIRPEVYNSYECVVFHMTDLPFGRGGSPLQNLIVRKYKATKLSALKVNEGLDTGDIYLKKDLELHGTAGEIFLRAGALMEEMIIEIITKNPVPQPQQGQPVIFKRRKPGESNIEHLEELEDVFDYIRMLDAEGYPKAFIETGNLRFEFSKASLEKDQLQAHVRIFKK